MAAKKTPEYKIKANKDYATRNQLKRVWVTKDIHTILTDGTFGSTQKESCNYLFELLVRYGIVK